MRFASFLSSLWQKPTGCEHTEAQRTQSRPCKLSPGPVSVTLAAVISSALLAQEQPRFRAGANLVRVDAYVTADGKHVTDLTMDDFEVLEDGVPQHVESFQLIQPRGPAPVTALREPNTVAESRAMAADPEARLFVVFMDIFHVQIEGSYHAKAPIMTLLNRVIGQDDLIGVMTPDMSPRQMTLARRPETIEGIFRDHWDWGQRGRLNAVDPRTQELRRCFGEAVSEELIRRRNERQTLEALENLIVHLEGIREERKFVLLLSEGWRLGGPEMRLTNEQQPPGPTGIGVDPGGRLRMDPDRGTGATSSCERERSMLAFLDLTSMFNTLIQRANRANISFYPLDPRGLVVFDAPIGPAPPPPPSVDAAILRDRYDALRTIAENTDGFAILNTNATSRGIERMVQDTGAYYLLGYYSTNTKLDGRYRRLTVRVKRKGVDVRARPGYLAPTKEEMTATTIAAAPEKPTRVMSTLRGTAYRRGPSTGLAYVESEDDDYRRTERLRFEVRIPAPLTLTARLLGPTGAPINVPVATSTRTDASGQLILVADLTLAPLAQGEYELELVVEGASGPEVVAYRFALIP
jgi:VWFA-related protein